MFVGLCPFGNKFLLIQKKKKKESSRPTNLEEEEEEEMTGLLDRYAARKRKRQDSAEREPDQAEGSNRPTTKGGSEMQAIVIPDSPKMGSRKGRAGCSLGQSCLSSSL